MRLPALLTTGALILIVAAFACGEGDKDASTLTPTPTLTLTPTSTITPTPTTQPDSTPSPDPRSAVLISPPENRADFLAELADKQIVNENCPYEPSSARADCGASGLYELVPPLPGDVGVCAVTLVEGNPVAVICSAPATTIVYEIP